MVQLSLTLSSGPPFPISLWAREEADGVERREKREEGPPESSILFICIHSIQCNKEM